jgi:hypothetical protein
MIGDGSVYPLLFFSPNIQTSLAVVKRLKLIDSGAIHLIGNRVSEAGREKMRVNA